MTGAPHPWAPVAAAVVGGGLAFAWYTRTHPGSSVVTVGQDLVQTMIGAVRLTNAQADAVQQIHAGFSAGGFGAWWIAAVANAWEESRLNPLAAGDVDSGGTAHSIGLFQLNDRGLGSGMTLAARQDPAQATARICGELRSRLALTPFTGASNADAAEYFAHQVERCAACGYQAGSAQLAVRRAHVDALFGAGVGALPMGRLA